MSAEEFARAVWPKVAMNLNLPEEAARFVVLKEVKDTVSAPNVQRFVVRVSPLGEGRFQDVVLKGEPTTTAQKFSELLSNHRAVAAAMEGACSGNFVPVLAVDQEQRWMVTPFVDGNTVYGCLDWAALGRTEESAAIYRAEILEQVAAWLAHLHNRTAAALMLLSPALRSVERGVWRVWCAKRAGLLHSRSGFWVSAR